MDNRQNFIGQNFFNNNGNFIWVILIIISFFFLFCGDNDTTF
ncbi:hypothetical protein SAMN04488500_101321 [Sporomusa malonica]|uniref:Uncharacterized protein n=1 Tax=Sporomusa malonica TaxID=112901 RepID=A0A1W1YFW0_9FIRM|nr:hypothetical protein SAMN04488500_101321 [Sporomusa malonica]